jgi:hypothetical protein
MWAWSNASGIGWPSSSTTSTAPPVSPSAGYTHASDLELCVRRGCFAKACLVDECVVAHRDDPRTRIALHIAEGIELFDEDLRQVSLVAQHTRSGFVEPFGLSYEATGEHPLTLEGVFFAVHEQRRELGTERAHERHVDGDRGTRVHTGIVVCEKAGLVVAGVGSRGRRLLALLRRARCVRHRLCTVTT